jgi:Transposase
LPQSRTGSRRRGKKGDQQVQREHLDHALGPAEGPGFSGYIAADELYDGPFCVLSLVDNHNFRRLSYRVLDHSPAIKDITRFFGDFKKELDKRDLVLRGITTDGSALYPKAITQVFDDVPHQICQFHVLKELNAAILHAVAKIRKQRTAQLPALPRGRPSKATRRKVACVKRAQQRIADLFEHRHLFVTHHLTDSQQRTLQRITRGLPQLHVLRQIMDQVYGLFDRRCHSDTALAKLAQLRRRVRRFKRIGKTLQRLFSPNLEKALTFLDDKLLPSTSNAVERGNRRHRKMQKSVYRVRTRLSLHRRMALDLLRETQAPARSHTTVTLHQARANTRLTL